MSTSGLTHEERLEVLESIRDALAWFGTEDCKALLRQSLGGRRITSDDLRKHTKSILEAPAGSRIYELVRKYGIENVVDTMGYDLFALIANVFVETGKRLPPVYAAFVSGVLKGTIKRKERGPSRYRNLDRDLMIAELVQELVEQQGLKPYRNEASADNSACDLVSQALEEVLGLRLSYKAVEKIYREKLATINSNNPWF